MFHCRTNYDIINNLHAGADDAFGQFETVKCTETLPAGALGLMAG